MRALALVLAVTAYPALAESYRPLPRYTPEKVRQRVAGSRAAQRVHSQPPVAPIAPVAATAPALAQGEEPVHVIAIPPRPEPPRAANRARGVAPPSPAPVVAAAVAVKPAAATTPRAPVEEGAALAAAPASTPAEPPLAAIAPAAAPPAPAKLADLKVTVGQASSDGGFVMLVEDPSGARIELTLDGGGRLLSVRRAGAL